MNETDHKSNGSSAPRITNRQTPVISLPGLLLLGPRRELVACNQEALDILAYPGKPGKRSLATLLSSKFSVEELMAAANDHHVIEFTSGNRRYTCSAHSMEVRGRNGSSIAFLLNRSPSPEVALCSISARYNLTTREREAMWHLLHGLTSKEIAQQMKISPNTVKAFLRLVMTKMGVSTRSGVIGRVTGVDSLPEFPPGPR